MLQFFDRDLSWLSFNERVLQEAANEQVPLIDRIRFLSIFSSNLDEFYRVRMAVLMAGKKNEPEEDGATLLKQVQQKIDQQLDRFGTILKTELLPALQKKNIELLYCKPIPAILLPQLQEYFLSSVAAYLQLVKLNTSNESFFSENNKLYQVAIEGQTGTGTANTWLVSIPSDKLPRFYTMVSNNVQYIGFLDDIIKTFLHLALPGINITKVFNIKITRDAELGLDDETTGDLAENIEKKIATRDLGYATRFLYEPGIPLRTLQWLTSVLQLSKANVVAGGNYHNLKDLAAVPVKDAALQYPSWPALPLATLQSSSLFDDIERQDQLVHTPYHNYDAVLRFFNEAAIDISVEEIYVTLYRIANESKVANALITAAKNGKKVTVFVELKARFDEANNINWGKKMKAAGVKIIYSIPGLKVHAKVGLVRRRKASALVNYGLLSTGNLNESTAAFYTDHVLLTAHKEMLKELEQLFIFLSQKRKPVSNDEIIFQHLIVAQFNLQPFFLAMIDKEIENVRKGLPAGIIVKLNNLEERTMITKLYDASKEGVKVQLLVRSICCLVPGVPGLSENITVTRIVDRYLEHGRVFIFNNGNDERIFLGSADWMNRNIYSRVEVCFPVYDKALQKQVRDIVLLQLADNVQAVQLDEYMINKPVMNDAAKLRSQELIYSYVKNL